MTGPPPGPGQPGPARGRRAALGIGANEGSPLPALRHAVDLIVAEPGVHLVGLSPLYRTAPVGGPAQPDYLNAVAVIDSTLSPGDLLALAHRAESDLGRTRTVRWGPRTLDVDILAVGEVVSADPALTLPHPRAHERAFVLVPWADVDPEFVVPGRGTVDELRAGLPADERGGVEPVARDWWGPDSARREGVVPQ